MIAGLAVSRNASRMSPSVNRQDRPILWPGSLRARSCPKYQRVDCPRRSAPTDTGTVVSGDTASGFVPCDVSASPELSLIVGTRLTVFVRTLIADRSCAAAGESFCFNQPQVGSVDG